MLTRRIAEDDDRDDRLQERIKNSDEGLSVPFVPKTREEISALYAPKKRQRKLSKATLAKHSHMNLGGIEP